MVLFLADFASPFGVGYDGGDAGGVFGTSVP